jgi:hypothetical protein
MSARLTRTTSVAHPRFVSLARSVLSVPVCGGTAEPGFALVRNGAVFRGDTVGSGRDVRCERPMAIAERRLPKHTSAC